MARSVGIDRVQVVAAAAALADEHGLEQLTLAQVATQLGVRLPSLYNHVEGLPGLRHELALLGGRQLLERISRAAVGRAGDEAVLAICRAYRAYVLERPGVYAASVRAPAPDDTALVALSQELIAILLAVLAPYGLSETDALHAIRGLRSVAHGFASIEAAGGFGMALDRDESFQRLVGGLIAGIKRVEQ